MKNWDVIAHNWRIGNELIAKLTDLTIKNGLENTVSVLGYGVHFVLGFPHDDEYQARLRRTYFMQECIKRGLLFFGSHNITAAHNEDEVKFTLDVCEEVMTKFAVAYQANDFDKRLDGPCIEPIFRQP